ncbi:MAG: hypothetical protein IJH61_04450 [Eubacteriaceae bacterium]|nr:hypothetical protein [Eubacteriaceae bacterium]
MVTKRISFTLTEDDADIIAFLETARGKRKGKIIKRALRHYIIKSRHDVKDSTIREFMFNNIDEDDIDETFIKIINSIRKKAGASSDLSIKDFQEPVIEVNRYDDDKRSDINIDAQEFVDEDNTLHVERENRIIEETTELPKAEDTQDSSGENDWIKDSMGGLLANLSDLSKA